MVFKGEDKHTKVVIVNCNCGCDEAIQIKKLIYDVNEDDEYYLTEIVITKEELEEYKKVLGEL